MKRKRNFERIKDIAAIVLFLILFPYFAVAFKEQKDELLNREESKQVKKVQQEQGTDNLVTTQTKEEKLSELYGQLSDSMHNQKYFVTWEEEGVSIRLPIENFLIGALAASIPVSYHEEVLKAQAIVLRSTLYREYEQQSELDNNTQKETASEIYDIQKNINTGNFWTDQKMQKYWGKEYENNLRKCAEAVRDTQGIYLSFDKKAIHGYYHGMSAGKTRSPAELSEDGKYDYLKQTQCPDNLGLAEYITQQKIKKSKTGVLTDAKTDEIGYVISVRKDGNCIFGEQLKNELELASSNFIWEEKGEYYIFTVNGKGHGFGLDQTYGNIMAEKGNDYRAILQYFFTNIEFQRME